MRRISRPALAALLLSALAAPPASAAVTGAPGIAIDGYDLVSSTRRSRTVYELTYAADVTNWSPSDAAVSATLTGAGANVTIVQGSLDFGEVAEGATQRSLGTFVVRVDRSEPFDEDALSWAAQATPLPPTTFELIDSALASGAIDEETALVYKVFSEFRDARLPTQYLGRDDGAREATAFQDAVESYATLSAATQAVLEPFLLPAEDPRSWYRATAPSAAARTTARAARKMSKRKRARLLALAGMGPPGCTPLVDPSTGDLVDGVILAANGKVCVHYFAAFPGDPETAVALADEIDRKIWPSLTGLFREPPLDADGRLQVYLVDAANMATLYTSTPGNEALGLATICAGNVPRIYLNRDKKAEINQTAAHEIFHAISSSYSRAAACGEARWLGEATATWAEHFVYPCVQSEQGFAPHFLNEPTTSLEDATGRHEYGAYLWFLFATRLARGTCEPGGRSGDAAYAPRVWNALSFVDSVHAVDIAISEADGLTKKWHEFVLHDWNRDQRQRKPYSNYWNTDQMPHRARESQGDEPVHVNLGGAVAKAYKLPHTVRHLGATYFHFDLTQDSTIRRVRLVQPYSNNSSGNVKVQAIVKTPRGWQQAVDWTGSDEKTLCRDKEDENFQELVIVISNSEFDDRSFVLRDDNGSRTKLKVSALGCSNWKGSATGDFHSSDPEDVIHATTDATELKLELDNESWLDDADIQQFRVNGGNVSWTYTENWTPGGFRCTGDFTGSYGLAGTSLFEGQFFLGVNAKPEYSFSAGNLRLNDEDYPLTCTPPIQGEVYGAISGSSGVANWILTSYGVVFPGIYDTAGGLFEGQLVGSFVFESRDGARTFSWMLEKDGTFADE
jgi:hypothetical protein